MKLSTGCDAWVDVPVEAEEVKKTTEEKLASILLNMPLESSSGSEMAKAALEFFEEIINDVDNSLGDPIQFAQRLKKRLRS